MKLKIDYETIDRIYELTHRFGDVLQYIDSMQVNDKEYEVTIHFRGWEFICADVTKTGLSFESILQWWIDLFESIPIDTEAAEAAKIIVTRYKDEGLPNNPEDMWLAFKK